MAAPLARSDLHSAVHPPVNAFGNQATTTYRPRSDAESLVFPSEPGIEKLGATSPTFSSCCLAHPTAPSASAPDASVAMTFRNIGAEYTALMAFLRSALLTSLAPALVCAFAWSCAGSGGSSNGDGGAAQTAVSGTAASGTGAGGGKTCMMGYADCDANPDNGCETFVVSDAKNCGACAKVCPTAKHASAACAASQCTLSCDTGYLDCNMSPDDGCEAALLSDAMNCGACGQVCATTCESGLCKPTVLAAMQAHPYDLALDADHVYWVNEGVNFYDDGTVVRVAKKGGQVQELAAMQTFPTSVAVDANNVYWTTYGTDTLNNPDGGVYSTPKVGGGAITTLTGTEVAAGAIAIDAKNAYFLSAGTPQKDYEDGQIRMVPLAGGMVKVLATGVWAPNDVAVLGKYVYWVSLGHEANNYLDASIWRVSIEDAVPMPVKLADKLAFATSVALDPAELYFPQALLGGVYHMKLEGGMPALAVAAAKGVSPFAVALDGPTIYFAGVDQNSNGSISRVLKAGGKPFKLAATPSVLPIGLAVDDKRIYWADNGSPDGINGAVYTVNK
jgi:hypothetical protein